MTAQEAAATFPGRDGSLLFSVYPSHGTRGLGALWSIAPDGRSLKLVSNSSCADYQGMRYSPDGRRIVYYGVCGRMFPDPGFEIFTMNADGTNRRLLATPPGQPNMTWSPDGRQIAYLNTLSGVLTVVDSRSGRFRSKFAWRGPVSLSQMSWGAGNRVELGPYSVRIDGTKPRSVRVVFPTSSASREVTQASWSASGAEIAVVGAVYTTICLTHEQNRIIHFDSSCGQLEHDDIYVVSSRGGVARRITYGGESVNPIWSPDGQSIAFYRNPGPGISIIAASGGRARRIGTNLRIFDFADWQAR